MFTMKKLAIGASCFIAGALLMTSVSSFAAPTLQKISANINNTIFLKLNGEKVETEFPIITYNGRTYVYLKEVGELVGASIEWNNTERSVEIVNEYIGIDGKNNKTSEKDDEKLKQDEKKDYSEFYAIIDIKKNISYDPMTNTGSYFMSDEEYHAFKEMEEKELRLLFCTILLSQFTQKYPEINKTGDSMISFEYSFIYKKNTIMNFRDVGIDNDKLTLELSDI